MSGNEETPAGKTAVASLPNDSPILDEGRGAAEAVLHRDIGTLLPTLRRYARSLTRDAIDADDLVQECVARALAKIHLWRTRTDLRAWLFSILHNQYVSQVRRTRRQGTTAEWSNCATALSCAPDQIEHLELREMVRALRSLPREQRAAVVMIGLTTKDYFEVAAACGVPVGTIRSRLSRGRQTLRRLTGDAPLPQHVTAGCAHQSRARIAALDPALCPS